MRQRSKSGKKVSKSAIYKETELRLMQYGKELKYRKEEAKNLLDQTE